MAKLISLVLLGVFLIVIGVQNLKGNLSTIRQRNRQRVAEEDLPKYGKCVGAGTLLIGASCILSAILELTVKTELGGYILLAGCLLGVVLMLYAQFRYNKGILS